MRYLVFSLLVAATASAQGEVRLQVQQTDPASPATLRVGDAFYARVLYDTDREIRIFGRPKGPEGRAVKSHPSPVYAAGAGEALVWFAFDEPGAVQAMTVNAVPANGSEPVATVEVPLSLEWTSAAGRRVPADWAEALNREQQARVRNAPAPDYGAGIGLLIAVLFGSVPAYLVVQAFAFWRFRGRRSALFWAPVVAMGAVYAFVLLGVMLGSNLAPIWLVFTSPVALIYVIVLVLVDFRRAGRSGT